MWQASNEANFAILNLFTFQKSIDFSFKLVLTLNCTEQQATIVFDDFFCFYSVFWTKNQIHRTELLFRVAVFVNTKRMFDKFLVSMFDKQELTFVVILVFRFFEIISVESVGGASQFENLLSRITCHLGCSVV